MKKILGLLKRTFIPSSPEDSPRTMVNWLILFAPFILMGLWPHRDYVFWTWLVTAVMWTWNITYAFVNRFYWRLFRQLNENTQSTMHTMAMEIQQAYYRMHEHCPQCGSRLKPPVPTETVQ